MYEEEIAVQFKAPFAMWGQPCAKLEMVSYLFPTIGGLRGILKSILHKNHIEMVPIHVEILAPIQQVAAPQYRSPAFGSPVSKSAPYSAVYLYRTHYRAHYRVWCEERSRIDRLRRRVESPVEGLPPIAGAFGPGETGETRAFHSPIYAGTRECMAEVVRLDAVKPVDVNVVEPCMALNNNGMFALVSARHGVVEYPASAREACATRRK